MNVLKFGDKNLESIDREVVLIVDRYIISFYDKLYLNS